MTFSIVARCERTGELGIAVSTAVPAVGAICPYLGANVGAVSTQSWVNPYLAMQALDQLGKGLDAGTAMAQVLEGDSGRDMRQLAIVDRHGGTAVWTGPSCVGWAGDRRGPGYTVQGNMLVGAGTLDAMADAYEASAGQPLAERLMRSLEAGQAAGGDKRGRQSASLKVMEREAYATLDLRVDDHPEPVAELRRVYQVAQQQFVPFVQGMPTLDDPGRAPPSEVAALLLKSPGERPGAPPPGNEVLTQWMGTQFAPDRLEHNLNVYRGIVGEIARLRQLDLAQLHPAVVFDPLRALHPEQASEA